MEKDFSKKLDTLVMKYDCINGYNRQGKMYLNSKCDQVLKKLMGEFKEKTIVGYNRNGELISRFKD